MKIKTYYENKDLKSSNEKKPPKRNHFEGTWRVVIKVKITK